MKLLKQLQTSKTRKSQRGFGALEFGLVLLLVAILTIAAILFYRDNLRKSSVNSNIAHILSISGAARSVYGKTNQYVNVTTGIAVQSNIIPAVLRDGAATTATNTLGGAIALAPAGAANDMLQITWPSVPSNQCSDIVMGIEQEGRRVQVAGVDVKALDAAVNIGTVAAQCDSAPTVTIDLFIGRS